MVVLAFVAGALAVWQLGWGTGDGAGGGPEVVADGGGDPGADPNGDPEGGGSNQELQAASYEPADCVTWDPGGGQADTDVVPCTEPHRIQITERVPVDDQEGYPGRDEWVLLIEADCGAAAERFLGTPLDPYGRFFPDAIYPLADSWSSGERTMWCGIGGADADDGSVGLFAEDVRGADQNDHHPVGTCLATPADAPKQVVPCTEAHHMEIVGELDLSDRPERPVGAQDRALHNDCAAQASAFLGADPVMPWQSGKETMTEESWAAGTRTVHCFLGQWDAQDELIEVTGSARG